MKPLKYEGLVIQIRENFGFCDTDPDCDSVTGCCEPSSGQTLNDGAGGLLAGRADPSNYISRLEERLSELEGIIKNTGRGQKMTLESEEKQLEKAIKALQDRHEKVASALKTLNAKD